MGGGRLAPLVRADGVAPVPMERGMRVNNYPLLMQAALEGQGIALRWGELIGGLLADGRLVRPLAHEYRTPRGYYLAVLEDSGACEAVAPSANASAAGQATAARPERLRPRLKRFSARRKCGRPTSRARPTMHVRAMTAHQAASNQGRLLRRGQSCTGAAMTHTSVELGEQHLGLLQVRGVEAFGEPAVGLGQHLAGVSRLALLSPQPA